MRSTLLVLLAAALWVSGCRKKPDPVPVPQLIDSGGVVTNDGHLEVVFENMVGTQVLQLNTQTYTNEAGNDFTVSAYKYYISNIKLWRADSTYFTEPESYHLINEALSGSRSFIIHEVPKGEYIAITFMIGVDADRNTSGAQTGALDPGNAMFWDWNTGYIMAKVEGTTAGGSPIGIHIGGFEGKDGVLRTVTLPLPAAANVSGSQTPEIHIKSDVLEWFKTPSIIDFNVTSFVTSAGPSAAKIADNYTDMFTITHVEN